MNEPSDSGADFEVRLATKADADGIRRVETAAFGRADEAGIVDAMRGTPDEVYSVVAEQGSKVVAHAYFTRVTINGMESLRGCALGPVGVEPELQSSGLGSAVIRAGIERCRATGWDVMFVLGDPGYYGRFGFELAAPSGFHYTSHDFDRGFQMQWLRTARTDGDETFVRYNRAFDDV